MYRLITALAAATVILAAAGTAVLVLDRFLRWYRWIGLLRRAERRFVAAFTAGDFLAAATLLALMR